MKKTSLSDEPSLTEQRRYAQQGFMLIWVTVLLIGIGAAVAAGMAVMKSSADERQALQARQALEWAEQALADFASTHGRLPCPARSAYGTEDCSSSHMKGWLPATTLKSGEIQANKQFTPPDDNYPAIRYMVYRNDAATLDLAKAQDNYRPRRDTYNADETGSLRKHLEAPPLVEHYNVNNLCEKLQRASPLIVSVNEKIDDQDVTFSHTSIWRPAPSQTNPAGNASFAGIQVSSHLTNVAYGLAISGAGAESGINAQNTLPQLESPLRAQSAEYSGMTRVMDFNRFSEQLGCAQRMASLDTIAVFASVADSIQAAKAKSYESTRHWAALTTARAAQTTFGTVLTILGVKEGVEQMAESGIKLKSAIIECAGSLGTACWNVARQLVALILATIGFAASNIGVVGAMAATGAETALARDYWLALAKIGHSIDMPVSNADAATEAACEVPAQLQDEIGKLTADRQGMEQRKEENLFFWNDLDDRFKPSPHYSARIQPITENYASARHNLEQRQEEERTARLALETVQQEQNIEPDYDAIRKALTASNVDNVDAVIAEIRNSHANGYQQDTQAEQDEHSRATLELAAAESHHQAASEKMNRLINEAEESGGNASSGYYLTYCPDLYYENALLRFLAINTCKLRLHDYAELTYRKHVNTAVINQLTEQIESVARTRTQAIQHCEFMQNLVPGKVDHPGYSVWSGAANVLRQATQLDNELTFQAP